MKKFIIFSAVALGFTACTTAKPEETVVESQTVAETVVESETVAEAVSFLNTKWIVSEVYDFKDLSTIEGLSDRPAFFMFDETSISGFNGGNNFKGAYTSTEDLSLTLTGPFMSQKMMAAGEDLASLEQKIMETLEQVNNYSIKEDVLTLFQDEIPLFTLKASAE